MNLIVAPQEKSGDHQNHYGVILWATIDVCTKFHGNPYKNHWDISSLVDWTTDCQTSAAIQLNIQRCCDLAYCSMRITVSLWVKQTSLMHSTPNKADGPVRSPVPCAAAVIFPKHLPWLNYQLWFLSLFTLRPNRLAVFTSGAIILPFIAAKATFHWLLQERTPMPMPQGKNLRVIFYFPYLWCRSGISVTKQAYKNIKYHAINILYT